MAAADAPEAQVVKYKLKLMYLDEEGDKCLLLNDQDVRVACLDRDKPLKIFAEILELSAVSKNPPTVNAPATRNVEPTRRTTEPTINGEDPPQGLNRAVESIVGVVADAVVGLQQATLPEKPTETPAQATPTAPPTPFIHGRHTCDSCLTTPIVGKRFHATNLADYDLCENCHATYTGTEIQFEEAVQDRDRPLQERWQRRFYKWRGRRHARGGFPCYTPPHVASHWVPPPPPQESSDAALKEAIRRSMADAQKQVNEIQKQAKEAEKRASEAAKKRMEEAKKHAEDARKAVKKAAKEFKASFKDALKNPPCQPFSSAPPAAALSDIDAALKEAISRSMEDAKQSAAKKTVVSTSRSPDQGSNSVSRNSPLCQGVTTTMPVSATPPCQAFSTKSTAATPSNAEVEAIAKEMAEALGLSPMDWVETKEAETQTVEPEIVVQPPLNIPTTPPPSAPKTPPSKPSPRLDDSTFALDAEGSGDVAAVLGETMDKIALAIQEMNVELERESKESDDGSVTTDSNVVVETVDAEEEKSGDVIVNGEASEDDASQNSWDVVEDQVVAPDESLARAAVQIGSALFHSGMSENAPNSNVSVTTVDSVPTTLSSLEPLVSAALVERWAGHLQRLHELGFYNDALIIETLERLQAANIGSGETEEITVERLVNELMKDW